MTSRQTPKSGGQEPSGWRNPPTLLALAVVTFSFAVIAILGIVAILQGDESNTTPERILSLLLPVIAAWVGTVLAYYYGRENFQSASNEVRETNRQLIDLTKITREQRLVRPVNQIMLPVANITYRDFASDQAARASKVDDLIGTFTATITRLPILTKDLHPLYMVHHLDLTLFSERATAAGNKDPDFGEFLDAQAAAGVRYGPGAGFAPVSRDDTVGDAKKRLDELKRGQDVFVTAGGAANEPLVGWIPTCA